ncbi:Aste57867_19022 [Aphanomyces stellatus]|uniref:Aste57867_19022 protein n=1 Tax=Aphanomyces stellatus TaxID=120398 RepID=A0A485LBV7_9STRA|nr:hypothetical protein As57867_018958 [Aphanomyces stellatus]VFT95747.1 Aste57867_19022 [Aphanomyces stellatus]
MAKAAAAPPTADFDLDESDVLFGTEEEDEDPSLDDELAAEMESTHIGKWSDRPDEGDRRRPLPRVESCRVGDRSSHATHQRWMMQSRSMPTPSKGFLQQQQRRWRHTNQLDTNDGDDDDEDDDDDGESAGPFTIDGDTGIPIPSQTTRMAAIPILSSAPLHWRRKSIEEFDDNQFVPPHQMVERDCFSLGMKHYFKHKPGQI